MQRERGQSGTGARMAAVAAAGAAVALCEHALPASHKLPWRVQIISIGSSGMQKTSQCIPVYNCHIIRSGCCTFASANVLLCSCRFQLEACLLQGCGSAVRHRCDSGRNAGNSFQGQLSGPKHMDGGAVSLCRGAQVIQSMQPRTSWLYQCQTDGERLCMCSAYPKVASQLGSCARHHHAKVSRQ